MHKINKIQGYIVGGGDSNSLQYSCLENSVDRGAWGTTVMASQGVENNRATNTHTHTHITGDPL